MNVEAYHTILKRLGIEPITASEPHALAASRIPPPEVVARLLAMPLDVFAREGQPLEVRVPWWPETLWFVPVVRDAEALWREGIARARVWTARELIALLEAAPLTTAALVTVTRARESFDGELVQARRR